MRCLSSGCLFVSEPDEKIPAIPGATDIGTEDSEDRGQIVEEEDDYRYNLPEGSSAEQASYFDLVEVRRRRSHSWL